ncbi:MAG: hypothetical protein C4581_04615 [Nitrospiraceae bacterium]|nr:MAG: hypothetical protein C4581_04615 [Nitrospiraceae bacterium]
MSLIALVLIIVGCSVPPPRSIIEKVIISHYESGPYKVMELVIGDIGPIPAAEKQYMGTEGYVVNVPSITLEFLRDIGEPWKYKKGHHMTFHDGTIRIKKTGDGEWLIVDIAGIPVL